jgi:phosphatidylserine/phosphatidylglycerophosphate/cardiolipin synthase-like enzyme
LPEDNSTEILALIGELIEHEAQVQVLVTQFLEIDQEGLMALRDDVAVALVLIVILLGTLDFAQWLTTDTAGWVLLGAGLTLIPGLPDSLLRDALVAIAEPSKDTVEAINSAHPGTAVWTPYPASLADNPLAPDPLTIAAVPVEEVVNHVGVYHHKIAMVKATQADPIAYLGGIDIDPDRVDDPLHRAAAPFHDIQVRLTGPAVNEVAKTYAERAAYHGASAPIAPAADSTALSGTGPHVVQVGRTYFAPAAGSTSQPLPSAPQGEHTTHDTLLQAIANAREYIYIEDQYFTPDTEFVEALVAAGAPERGLRGLVITLVQDNGQLFGALRRDDIIHRLAESWQERFRVGTPLRRYLNPEPGTFGGLGRMVLRMEAKVGDEELVLGPATRCPTPPFWAFVESELVYVESIVPNGAGTGPIGPQDPGSPDPADQTWQKVQVVRGPEGDNPRWGAKPDHHDKGSCVLAVQVPEIYVHAKLMVVDDVFLSVGSTNFNRRSLEHDGEIHTFTLPASLKRDPTNPALRVRCRVWAEHFGLPPEMGLSLLADPVSALAYFDRSWYRGSRWQPLRWTTAGQAPAIAIPTVGNILLQLLAIAEGALLDDEKSPIWAAMVDPTTANDPHVDPATDRGPLL